MFFMFVFPLILCFFFSLSLSLSPFLFLFFLHFSCCSCFPLSFFFSCFAFFLLDCSICVSWKLLRRQCKSNFLEPWNMNRQVRLHWMSTTQWPRYHSQLGTEGKTVRVMRTTAQLREGQRSTRAKRRAQQAPASGLKTDRFSILRGSQTHTTSLLVLNSACLKHSELVLCWISRNSLLLASWIFFTACSLRMLP